ncbi:Hint domain-containing protein [Streptomyces sp. NPDC020747]|uniref:Hint domain-containing protein n=1 Tax=Streptomyces sp. NPDC020747 TaxID=3365086 RepID=UPI00378AF5DC
MASSRSSPGTRTAVSSTTNPRARAGSPPSSTWAPAIRARPLWPRPTSPAVSPAPTCTWSSTTHSSTPPSEATTPRSSEAAQTSSNQAAASAKAAKQAEANIVEYDRRAVEDAEAAQKAATSADGYATEADAAADDAERDAASARSAADAAEADASTARGVADQAEKDATTAETAAANSRDLAVEAAQAAIRTQEVEFEDRQEDQRTPEGSGTGLDGVVMKPSGDSRVDINPKSDCVGTHTGGDIGCEIDLEFHIYGEMDFYLESCPLPGVSRAKCGSSIKRDYLMSSPLDVTFREDNVHVDGLELTASVLKAVATGAVADIVGCWNHKISSCLRPAGSIILPSLLMKAAEAAFAVHLAVRNGSGIGAAIWGLRGSGLSASAAANLQRVGQQALKAMCFPAGTKIATEHGTKPIEEIEAGDRVWAEDPATGERRLRRVAGPFPRRRPGLRRHRRGNGPGHSRTPLLGTGESLDRRRGVAPR